MTSRKKKLLLIQLTLFILGLIIIIYTYNSKKIDNENVSLYENQKKIIDELTNQTDDSLDVFYNIKYSGIDLAGNRYILKSKEATNSNVGPEIVNMKFVEVTFYFKDDTILKVFSDSGTYNNKTLDMDFEKNVRAFYEESKLAANKASYSNVNGYLTISEDVIVSDKRGSIIADKLLFDIKKQNLNIISFNDSKINAKINIK